MGGEGKGTQGDRAPRLKVAALQLLLPARWLKIQWRYE